MSQIYVHFVNPNTEKQTAVIAQSFIIKATLNKLQEEISKKK